MTTENREATFTAPSKFTLLKITGAALAAAAVLLFLVVLPAEYGVDVTGFGRMTGLTALNQVGEDQTAEGPATPGASTAAEQPASDGAQPLPWEDPNFAPPANGLDRYANFHDTPPKTDVIEVQLNPREEVEFKATLKKGEPMFFSWSIPDGDIYYDFHGEPTEGTWPEGYFLSYGDGEAGTQSGSFVSPFTGIHGWYWLNYNEEPVTIRLTLEGYYESFGEIYRGSR